MTMTKFLSATLAIAFATGLVVWAATRAQLFWMSEAELSQLALLSLEADASLLRSNVESLQDAATRFGDERGITPKSLSDVVGGSTERCGLLPAGFREWNSECETHDQKLGWFGYKLLPNPEPRIAAFGCRWFGSKLGCLSFPDPGPPIQCEWCAQRSRSVDGWRITLEPGPQT